MTVTARKAQPSTHPTPARTGVGSRRDEVGHTHISQIQRARILAAMFGLASKQGAANVSVADVVERSGVSRRTFYELFEDREACFLAAFEDALALATDRVLAAYDPHHKWVERVRAGLIALLCFLDEQRVAGRLLICESLTAGSAVLARRGEVLDRLECAIDEGRSEAVGATAPPLTAEGLVGGVLSLVHTRLAQGEQEPLLGLANPLMSMIVLPYLGQAASRRELERPLPSVTAELSDRLLMSDPFKEAGMRLTYRTLRVLLTIAELREEGITPSNRQVGDRAGITDQGQISKLLARLHRIGLTDNSGLGPGAGAPNRWSLTAKGARITESAGAHLGVSEGADEASRNGRSGDR